MTSRAIVFSKWGEPSEVVYQTKYDLPALGDTDVQLKLLASPVNPSDVAMISGRYATQPEKTTTLNTDEPAAVGGMEGVFQVEQIGAKVTKLAVGDWCIGLAKIGTWQTRRVLPEDGLLPLKDRENLTVEQAGTIVVNPTTAYLMLQDERVGMQAGDYWVQNGANSHLGKLAIQLGKKFGFKSINVVRKRADLDELKKQLTDLGADHVITDEELADAEFVKSFKEKLGEDANIKLGLNIVGGVAALQMGELLSTDGHVLTYGAMKQEPMLVNPGAQIMKNITYHGYWVTAWAKKNPMAMVKLIYDLLAMYSKKELIDSSVTTHTWSDSQSDEEFLKSFKSALGGSGKHVMIYE